MHTCISSHGLKKSWHLCPSPVNASNKNTPSMHYPQRQNVTTSMVGLKKLVMYAKNPTQNGEPQRYSWEHSRRRRRYQWLRIWYSSGYPARRKGLQGQCWSAVCILCLGQVASLICNFYFSVATHTIVQADLFLRQTLYAAGTLSIKDTTTKTNVLRIIYYHTAYYHCS